MCWGLYALTSVVLISGCIAFNDTAVAGQSVDNPQSSHDAALITRSQLERGNYVINVVIKPIVCISGFVMNVIGIWVLLDQSLRHSSYRYFLGLIVADTGFLLCGILRTPSRVANLTDRVGASYIEAALDPPTKFYAEHAFAKVSAVIICFLASERLLAILRPLKVKSMVLSQHAGKINIAVFGTIFVLYIPRLFDVKYVLRFEKDFNQTMYFAEKQNHTESMQRFLDVHKLIVHDIVILWVPVLVLLLCNIGIAIQLYRIRKRRKTIFGAASAEQFKVTSALLVVSGSFLLTYIPLITTGLLMNLYPDVYGRDKKEENLMKLMRSYTGLSWSVNSANDFIIYLATNTKFRSAFKKKTNCKKKHISTSQLIPKTPRVTRPSERNSHENYLFTISGKSS